MRYLHFVFMVVVIITFSASAGAQLYEYRDADGNIRFTDDLGNVPGEQRANVKRIRGVPRAPASDPWVDPPAEADDVFQVPGDPEETGIDLFEMGDALRQEQAELQAEYERIEETKAKIGDPPEPGAPRAAFDAYGDKVDELNNWIKDYQERLKDHENRVQAYNARVQQ